MLPIFSLTNNIIIFYCNRNAKPDIYLTKNIETLTKISILEYLYIYI